MNLSEQKTIHLGNYGTTLILNVPLPDMHSKCLESSNLTLSDLVWNVRICGKKSSSGKIQLGVYLDSHIYVSNWIAEAEATFKLFYKEYSDLYVSHSISWYKFSNASSSNGITDFLQSKELDAFVTDGKLRFEIEITTRPLQVVSANEMERIGAKIRAVIKDVSHLANGSSSFSSAVVIRGIRFQISTKLVNKEFAAFLHADEENLGYDWFTNVTVTMKIMPYNTHNPNDKPIESRITRTYRKNLSSYSVSLYNWDKLIDSNSVYVINDTAVMLFEIDVDEKEPIWGLDANRQLAHDTEFE